MISGKLDLKGVFEAFDQLAGSGKESLARRMGAGAGRVIRDEAIQQVPVGKPEAQAVAQFGGSKNPGSLRDAMYLGYNKKASTSSAFTYSVSWNRRLAPHGHLVEFGHWRPYAIVYIPGVGWRTDQKRPLPGQGKWVPARPFLSVAYHMKQQEAFKVALQVGREEFPKILQGETE